MVNHLHKLCSNVKPSTIHRVYLAGERQAMLVGGLGQQAVPGVLLGGPDVLVDNALGLEPHTAAIIGTAEGELASVIHLVKF